jgi:hypothetical protein
MSGGVKSSYQVWLKRKWNRNPKCYYCKQKTIFENRQIGDGILKPNAATVEHLYSKLDIRRLLQKNTTVLACYHCNQERCFEDQKRVRYQKFSLNILELWATPEILLHPYFQYTRVSA